MTKVVQKIMLDVGCGSNCSPGFVGMDKRKLKDVQIHHDVELIPWPLENESCAVVLMSHLIEHIKPWKQIDVIDEAWRVLTDNGLLLISTPHGKSFGYIQDPTHCSPWNEATPQYFCPGTYLYEVYKPKPWQQEKLTWSEYSNIEVALRKLTIKEGKKIHEKFKAGLLPQGDS